MIYLKKANMKSVYLFRVSTSEQTFVIYRLSGKSRWPIKVMATGIAFSKTGHYSDKFIRDAKRYDVDISDKRSHGTWETTDSFDEFCHSVHIGNHNNKLNLHPSIIRILEHKYNNSEKTEKRNKILELIKENEGNKELVDKLYEILI